MGHVLHEHVEDALRELADAREQRRLWTASSGPEVSWVAEARCRLWQDSGLADALTKDEPVYTWAIDNRLRLLHRLLEPLHPNLPVDELLDHPGLAHVRTVARALLIDLNNLRYSSPN